MRARFSVVIGLLEAEKNRNRLKFIAIALLITIPLVPVFAEQSTKEIYNIGIGSRLRPGVLGWTELMEAVFRGDQTQVQALIGKGVDLDAVAETGDTALAVASCAGQLAITRLLLAHGADANLKGRSDQTPLHCASRSGHVDIVKALLDQKADPNVADGSYLGLTPLRNAAASGRADVVEVLLPHIDKVKEGNALLLAAINGHTEVARLLLDAGIDVNAPDDRGVTALLHAVRNGNGKLVKLLLARGAKTEVVAKDNGTFPLGMAVADGHADIVAALLAAGAKFSYPGCYSLLEIAKSRNHAEIVALLRSYGVYETTPANRQFVESGISRIKDILAVENANSYIEKQLGAPKTRHKVKESRDRDPSIVHVTEEWEFDGLTFELAFMRNEPDDGRRSGSTVEKIVLGSTQYALVHDLRIGLTKQQFVQKLGRPTFARDRSVEYCVTESDEYGTTYRKTELTIDQDLRVRKISWVYVSARTWTRD